MQLAMVGSAASSHWGITTGTDDLIEMDFICHAEDFKGLVEQAKNWYGYNLQWIRPTPAGMAVAFLVRQGGMSEYLQIYDAEFIDRENPSSRLVYEAILAEGEELNYGRNIKLAVASLDMLYLLKMSHRFKKNSPHFLKTMRDINILRAAGAEIKDEALFKAREEATYAYSHPNLKRTKDEFFITTGELEYKYDHDSIHEAMAHRDRPMYTYYAVDGEQVLSSRSKFEKLDYTDRIYGVLEEAYVLALERSVIPFGTDPKEAFLMALEKVCTSITSGWFREFAWENYYLCLAGYNPDYVTKFQDALEKGIIKEI